MSKWLRPLFAVAITLSLAACAPPPPPEPITPPPHKKLDAKSQLEMNHN